MSVISIQGLEVKFPGCDALNGVDLNVQPGRVFALLGENGAGKTTLIRVLTGFQSAGSGKCSVLGLDPSKDAIEIRRRVGYVSDAPALYDWMQIDEIGWFAASFYEGDFLEQYRASCDKYELPVGRKIKHLSKGQRAKVALSLALAHDPELLILDEPTSGLDPLVRREFLESMLDRVATGRTVFLSSHQISEVERVADEIAILHKGQFQLQGQLSELRESVSEVTISLDDPLAAIPQLPAPAVVLREESEGRQRRLTVSSFADEMREELLARSSVQNVAVRSVSLDDLFVACTRPTTHSPSTHSPSSTAGAQRPAADHSGSSEAVNVG